MTLTKYKNVKTNNFNLFVYKRIVYVFSLFGKRWKTCKLSVFLIQYKFEK